MGVGGGWGVGGQYGTLEVSEGADVLKPFPPLTPVICNLLAGVLL